MAAPNSGREALKRQFHEIIQAMEDEGMVDYLLNRVHSLRESGPFFFASVVPTFCQDSTETFGCLTATLSQPDPNYHEMSDMCFKIRGSASIIGACRMSLACRQLH